MNDGKVDLKKDSKIDMAGNEIICQNDRLVSLTRRLQSVNDRLLGVQPQPENPKNKEAVTPTSSIDKLEFNIKNLNSVVSMLDNELTRLTESGAV